MGSKTLASIVLFAASSVAFAGNGPTAAVSGYLTSEEIDVGGGSADGLGFGIKGWGKVANQFLLTGEYQTAELEVGSVDFDLDQLRVGGGFLLPMDNNITLFARAEFVQIDIEGDEADGFGIHVGGIVTVSPQVNVYGSLGMLDLEDDSNNSDDGLEFLIGGEFMFAPNLGAFIEYRDFGGDEFDLTDLRGGVTYYFGNR